MEDSGFNELFNVKKTDGFNLSLLKEKKIPISPVFSLVKDGEFGINDLINKEFCLCSIFKYLSLPVLPKGNKESKYIFVADAPDDAEGEEGEKFFQETETGHLFSSMLDILNLERSDIYLTTYVFCRDETRAVNSKTAFNCSLLHKAEFSELKGMEYIFTLGTRPFHLVTGIFGNTASYIGSYIKAEIFGKQVTIIPLHSPTFLIDNEEVRNKNFEVLEKLKQ